MGYENEKYIKNVIGTESVFSHEKDKRQERIEELQEVYRKAKALEEIKNHVDKEVDFYMALYRETKDPTYSSLNSHYDALLGYIEELEDDLDGI